MTGSSTARSGSTRTCRGQHNQACRATGPWCLTADRAYCGLWACVENSLKWNCCSQALDVMFTIAWLHDTLPSLYRQPPRHVTHRQTMIGHASRGSVCRRQIFRQILPLPKLGKHWYIMPTFSFSIRVCSSLHTFPDLLHSEHVFSSV